MKWHWFPVACIWNEWGSWELCTTTCGTGSMTRSRSKYGPFYGGADCSGSETSSIPCNTNPCPGMKILESIRINKGFGSQYTAPGTTGNLGTWDFVQILLQILLACPPWLDPDQRMNRYTAVTIARGLHHLQITAVIDDLHRYSSVCGRCFVRFVSRLAMTKILEQRLTISFAHLFLSINHLGRLHFNIWN